MGKPTTKNFCVLMATFNGADHIDEQLRSIADQTAERINVIVSDDGSRDATMEKLTDWQDRWAKGSFLIQQGPKRGFAENFRSLIVGARTSEADFFAFSDQDDIWMPDKLAVAAKTIGQVPAGRLGLYCGRTQMINEAGRAIGRSPLMARPPSFRNALVQSIAGGNTMVMNGAAAALLAKVSAQSGYVSHDWWAYLWVTGAGGQVSYDSEPRIQYRQHGANLVGSNSGAAARLSRMQRLLQGQFRNWTDQNLEGLMRNKAQLTHQNADLLHRFSAARATSRTAFLRLALSEGIVRQSPAGTLSLCAGIALGRI